MKKEKFEWIRSWCDNTDRTDLPRVLLIGDSITEGYQSKVRSRLDGSFLVDYIATSYAVDCPFYNNLIESFADDSKYDIIHFNHGLHGMHMTTDVYEKAMDELTEKLCRFGKVIAVTSTKTYAPDTDTPTAHNPRVLERNEAVRRIAKKYALTVDELYTVSEGVSITDYSKDGTHFADAGYEALSESVAASVKGVKL